MSAPDVQSVLCVGSSETSNNRDIGLNLSPSFSRKYTKYANYTPWPTPCEVAVEMQAMASCEHLAAATQGWAAFDWAEHCLKHGAPHRRGRLYARVIFGDSGKSGNASTNTSFVQKIFHITE